MGDLVQEATWVHESGQAFDPYRWWRLVSFAVHWIRAEFMELSAQLAPGESRTDQVATQNVLQFAQDEENLAWFSEAEDAAVARDWGSTWRTYAKWNQRLSARDMSFDPTPESDEEETYSPASTCRQANADPAIEVESEEWKKTRERLTMALSKNSMSAGRSILKRRWMTRTRPPARVGGRIWHFRRARAASRVERHQQGSRDDGGRLTRTGRPSTSTASVRVAIRSHVERAAAVNGRRRPSRQTPGVIAMAGTKRAARPRPSAQSWPDACSVMRPGA